MLVPGATEVGPWDFGWEAIAALATIALAATTAGLALTTLWVARKTRDLAKATNAELVSDWRPVLTLTQVHPDNPMSQAIHVSPTRVKITVLNSGRGPAMRTWVWLDRDPQTTSPSSEWRTPIRPEKGHVFDIAAEPDSPFPDPVVGHIWYSDIADIEYETVFEISSDPKDKSGAKLHSQFTHRVAQY